MDAKQKQAMVQMFDGMCKNSIVVSYAPIEDTAEYALLQFIAGLRQDKLPIN